MAYSGAFHRLLVLDGAMMFYPRATPYDGTPYFPIRQTPNPPANPSPKGATML